MATHHGACSSVPGMCPFIFVVMITEVSKFTDYAVLGRLFIIVVNILYLIKLLAVVSPKIHTSLDYIAQDVPISFSRGKLLIMGL